MLDTPILLITFNRPNQTKKVLEEIKKQKPKYLYLFQDGARSENEKDRERCAQVREILNTPMSWDCEVKTYFSDVNLGCGRGPSSGISWFFKHVDQGIIFEDDCLPHNDFFLYCQDLLNLYRDNKRISFIGGTNFQDNIQRGNGSYYFSAGHHGTWGWATWKRTWEKFDYMINDIDEHFFKTIINRYFHNTIQKNYWLSIFKIVKENRMNESCWDYQFYFSCWKENALAIIPNTNLITNIGFDSEATHTFSLNDKLANKPLGAILPLVYPDKVKHDIKADLYLHKHYVQSYAYGISGIKRIPYKINKRIKKLLGHEGSWFKK